MDDRAQYVKYINDLWNDLLIFYDEERADSVSWGSLSKASQDLAINRLWNLATHDAEEVGELNDEDQAVITKARRNSEELWSHLPLVVQCAAVCVLRANNPHNMQDGCHAVIEEKAMKPEISANLSTFVHDAGAHQKDDMHASHCFLDICSYSVGRFHGSLQAQDYSTWSQYPGRYSAVFIHTQSILTYNCKTIHNPRAFTMPFLQS